MPPRAEAQPLSNGEAAKKQLAALATSTSTFLVALEAQTEQLATWLKDLKLDDALALVLGIAVQGSFSAAEREQAVPLTSVNFIMLLFRAVVPVFPSRGLECWRWRSLRRFR